MARSSTTFKPGQVTNPLGGRAGMTPEQIEARAIMKGASPQAARRIIELMSSSDEKIALAAAKTIVDKFVPDALDGETLKEMNPLAGMTPAQLLEIARSK